MSDPVQRMEAALDTWRTFGDVPARLELMQALNAYVANQIAVYSTKTCAPFCVDTSSGLSDSDYEALMKPSMPFEAVQFPYDGPRPVYLGSQRPTCAVCASLMVQGLCSNDAAHYQ